MAKLIFCAKEAAYKCQYSLTRQLFGFDGLEIRVNAEAGSFEAVLSEDQGLLTQGTVIPGRFSIACGLVMTAAEVRGEPLP
jgi:4'-phosphopantetheinyl transferase EntD